MPNLLVLAPPAAISRTVYYDQPNNIRAELTPGRTDFWFDAELAFRLLFDSTDDNDSHNNGFWTTYAWTQAGQSGAGSGPVEVISTTQAYIVAKDVRRMLLDKTANTISNLQQEIIPSALAKSGSDTPIDELDFHTVFQVFDPGILDYVTVASLGFDGVLTLGEGFPWRQRNVVGDIPS